MIKTKTALEAVPLRERVLDMPRPMGTPCAGFAQRVELYVWEKYRERSTQIKSHWLVCGHHPAGLPASDDKMCHIKKMMAAGRWRQQGNTGVDR